MRNDMLFIDGALVDLDDNTKITLNFKSNILTDISKIVSNNSYTIKLPKTVRNQRIIMHADLPSCESEYPRKFHRARYFRNGVEIVPDANAVLISVSDSIEIAMAWGNFTAFSKVIEDGIALNELGNRNDFKLWTENIVFSDYGSEDILFSDIDFGLKDDEMQATYHPSVRATYVLDMIKDKYGLNFVFPEREYAFIHSLIIPLLTRNGGYANEIDSHAGMQLATTQDAGNGSLMYWAPMEYEAGFPNVLEYLYPSNSIIARAVKAKVDGTVVITPNMKSPQNDIVVFWGDNDVTENYHYLPYTIIDDEYPYLYDIPLEIDLLSGQFFTLGRRVGHAMVYPNTKNLPWLNVGMKQREIQIGDKFPIVENLPAIKIMDFLKAVCAMTGLFVISTPNEFKFAPVDSIRDNLQKAKDWTKRVIADTFENKPFGITYSINDFARNNRMKWKEDDTVIASYNGNIVVDDETIDYEKDAVVMPFSASDTVRGVASVPIYSYDVSDGKLEYSSVEPRILIESANSRKKSKGIFNGLDFGTLISNYYQTYQALIRKPVVITEKIEINDIELKNLDMTIPVYLAQYGRYYAIISVKAEDTGICECKLLQLEV